MAAESVVLEEEIDQDYEPTQEEIIEYATWLGMVRGRRRAREGQSALLADRFCAVRQDLEADKELFWVAREGLKAPLPPDWKPCKSPDGEIYYFNFSNGERCVCRFLAPLRGCIGRAANR